MEEEAEFAEKTSEPVKESTRVYKFYIPGPSLWTCEHCDTTLKVSVGLTELPMHACVKRRGISFPLAQKVREKAQRLSVGV
jgi:hypothetical protein